MEIFVLIGVLAIIGGLYYEFQDWRNWRFWNWLFEERPWWQFWHPNSGIAGGAIMGIVIGLLVFVPILFGWWLT